MTGGKLNPTSQILLLKSHLHNLNSDLLLLKSNFLNLKLLPLEPSHHCACHSIAHNIGSAAAHVKQLVNRQKQ